MKKISILIAMFLMVLSLAGCISVTPGNKDVDKKEALSQIDTFHELYNKGDSDAIYNFMGVAAQRAVSKEDISQSNKLTNDYFGKFEKINDYRINVLTDRAPVEVRAVTVSKYEKGSVTEIYIFAKEKDKVKLISYKILDGETDLTKVTNGEK